MRRVTLECEVETALPYCESPGLRSKNTTIFAVTRITLRTTG